MKIVKRVEIAALTLALILIFGSVGSVFANESLTNLEKPIQESFLSYSQAVDIALKRDRTLKEQIIQNEISEIQMEDLIEEFGYSFTNLDYLRYYKTKKADEINSEKSDRLSAYVEESLKYGIKALFYNIKSTKDDIEFHEQKISNLEKKNKIVELKYEHGLESKTNFTSAKIELEKLYKEKETLIKNLDDYYISLNKLLGYPSEKRYGVEKVEFVYEPVNDDPKDLQVRISRAIDSSLTVWGNKQALDMSKIDVDLYSYYVVGGNLYSPQPHEIFKLESKTKALSVEQSKEDVENAVVKSFHDIKKTEAQLEQAKVNLKTINEKKRILEVAINAGTAIGQDYQDLMLAEKELNMQLDKLIAGHELQKEKYLNPYLAGGGA